MATEPDEAPTDVNLVVGKVGAHGVKGGQEFESDAMALAQVFSRLQSARTHEYLILPLPLATGRPG